MAAERLQHPCLAELEGFLLGQLRPSELVRVVAHLLTGCASCRAQMEPLAKVLFTPNHVGNVPVEVGSEYDFPLFRAFAAAKRYTLAVARERREATGDHQESLLREVPLIEPPRPDLQAARDWKRCEQLVARIREVRHEGPAAMVAVGSLAVCMAEALPPEFLDRAELFDLQARAWAERGNARRLADDLSSAESDLACAFERAAQGTTDPSLLAHLMRLTAALRTDQRRFQEALQLLDWVYTIHSERGETHDAGRALISKSNVCAYALDLNEAVRLLGQGVALLDPKQDPKLALIATHNLLWNLVDVGRVTEAARLLQESRAIYDLHSGPIERLKARWLEGRIAWGSEDAASAERTFQEVREGFAQAGLAYDQALVSLDLAALWLEQGRNREAQSMLDETVTIFETRGIHREAMASLLLLKKAVEREQATKAMLQQVAADLAGRGSKALS
jgi:tetratricopeptide (TPR) repeat protein